jgi:hypothetical protein
MSKPKVRAHKSDGYDEIVLEVSHELGGFLLSIRPSQGQLLVEIYRADEPVEIINSGSRD